MKTFIINEEEKKRILGMHKSATSNHYLTEQESVNPTEDLTPNNLSTFQSLNGESYNIDFSKKLIYGPGKNFNIKNTVVDLIPPQVFSGKYKFQYFGGNQYNDQIEKLKVAAFEHEVILTKYPMVSLQGSSSIAIVVVERNKAPMIMFGLFNPNF